MQYEIDMAKLNNQSIEKVNKQYDRLHNELFAVNFIIFFIQIIVILPFICGYCAKYSNNKK
jgi:hypothetical protein